jgi:hypothetical protein
MSGQFGTYYIQQDYVFMNKIITQFKQVLGVVPVGKYGAQTYFDLNFSAVASSVDNVSLELNGLIAYLYFSVYGTNIPDIFRSPLPILTQLEKDQIYTVYDAINVPRPNL